jgi:hypothetical protein
MINPDGRLWIIMMDHYDGLMMLDQLWMIDDCGL